jgi:aldose 1-epimerase
MKKYSTLLLCAWMLVLGCKQREQQENSVSTETTMATLKPFGKLPDGQTVTEFTLTNKNGISLGVINYGAIITFLKTPNNQGIVEDIVLGYDSLTGYLDARTPYFGAVVGRYGNRIANGKFSLDGNEYTLAQNNNGQHLHGGLKGFDKVFWTIEDLGNNTLKLTYVSKDGEEGYPGNLSISMTYTLTDENELKIAYEATTDKKTVVNLTQHSYFNLAGNTKRDILNHELTLYADKYIPVTDVLIPTGKLEAVAGTPFDFNTSTAIGARVNDNHPQLKIGGGYDHCWVLSSADSVKHAASVYEPTSGRVLDVFTTEPGIQFYCGNFLDGSLTGKFNTVYAHRYGLALETQHFPDSPNQKDFPSTELAPGEVYKTYTTFKFGVR